MTEPDGPPPPQPPRRLPADPFWRRFRELKPEVTLVLLPEAAPSGTDGQGRDERAEATAPPPVDSATVLAEAEQAGRHLRVAARSLMLDGEPTDTWITPARGLIAARQTLVATTPPDLPDARTIAFQLSRLGWDTVVRASRRPHTTWVEGTGRGRTLRFSAVGDTTTLVVTSAPLPVAADTDAELRGEPRG